MSDIVDAAESHVDLGSWSHAGSILTKKRKYVNEHWCKVGASNQESEQE